MSQVGRVRPLSSLASRIRWMWVGLTLIIAVGVVPVTLSSAAAAEGRPCGPPAASVIAREQLPGAPPSAWQVGSTDSSIQGFRPRSASTWARP